MPIKPDALKPYLEIGQKLVLLGGFVIFFLHCADIQRLPDADLPTLIVLFAASFGFFAVLLFGTSLLAFCPPLFIRNIMNLRCGPPKDRNKAVFSGAMLPGIWVSCAGWLALIYPRFRQPQWMPLASLTVICVGLLVLSVFTKRYWVRVLVDKSSIDESEVRVASWAEVLFAFFVWAAFTIIFVVILSRIIVSGPFEWLLVLFVALLVLLANFVIVPVLVGSAGSPENWKGSFIMIAALVFLLLFTLGLPRLVFGSLGVGYIFCESGTVLVNKAAADKIWRVLPDAIDLDEPMPVLIQKYDVEIVSKIGKEALLKFSLGPNERWNEKVFVPTESIADYRQLPQ